MKGLELSEKYFEAYGRPMLDAEFRDILPLRTTLNKLLLIRSIWL